mmetsp:Transcript_29466/g.75499  ORF Transcript_29466/g.75499 Transcript_29466/m.75499 type:complete len:203 (+) Transcript_29466:362-970(+)
MLHQLSQPLYTPHIHSLGHHRALHEKPHCGHITDIEPGDGKSILGHVNTGYQDLLLTVPHPLGELAYGLGNLHAAGARGVGRVDLQHHTLVGLHDHAFKTRPYHFHHHTLLLRLRRGLHQHTPQPPGQVLSLIGPRVHVLLLLAVHHQAGLAAGDRRGEKIAGAAVGGGSCLEYRIERAARGPLPHRRGPTLASGDGLHILH